jgi:hypothetical protein
MLTNTERDLTDMYPTLDMARAMVLDQFVPFGIPQVLSNHFGNKFTETNLLILGTHPNLAFALLASPRSVSTSVGRKLRVFVVSRYIRR